MTTQANPRVPPPGNEPKLDYAPGSPERARLKAALARRASEPAEIPLVIGGEEVRTGRTVELRAPHDHSLLLARVHQGGAEETRAAIAAADAAWREWSRTPWHQRASVLLKAADLLAGPLRPELSAAAILGQSKTVWEAEIDAICETIDFWRFNAWFASRLYADQPPRSPRGVWNRSELRPLEGFVLAVTPFNFVSIAANLPTAPALMGNVALWKPAPTAVYAAWVCLRALHEAGLPPGVVQLLQGDPAEVGDAALDHPDLAGVHFTGSPATFDHLYRRVAANLDAYRSYPRFVGETGGKDFVFAHSSADVPALVTALTRGAFEYQGQKCSAASRAYVPASLWPDVLAGLRRDAASIEVGDPRDFRSFMGALIDERAFRKVTGYIERAREREDAEVVIGGGHDRSAGWFVQPTVIRAHAPDTVTMVEEVFGPVLTVYVYPDAEYEEHLRLCDRTSPYALTGAVFARDRAAVDAAERLLWQAAGNFYINDKPTGSVVGQQPFGGARRSGTNDKAGSWHNLTRWTSPRAVKETFDPPTDFRYPFMAEA